MQEMGDLSRWRRVILLDNSVLVAVCIKSPHGHEDSLGHVELFSTLPIWPIYCD